MNIFGMYPSSTKYIKLILAILLITIPLASCSEPSVSDGVGDTLFGQLVNQALVFVDSNRSAYEETTDPLGGNNQGSLDNQANDVKTFTFDYWEYQVIDDSVKLIKCLWHSATDIEIPAEIDGMLVRIIGTSTFSHNRFAESICIPPTVTTLEDHAFYRCHSLKRIYIPESIESISYSAFYRCNSLTAIEVSTGNRNYSSYNGVLYNKDQTEICTYPEGKADENFIVPGTVERINYNTFSRYNDQLMTVHLPTGVRQIESNPFYRCRFLTEITVDFENDCFSSADGVLFNKDKSILVAYPMRKAEASYTIPSTVKRIEAYAFFSFYSTLHELTIPANVTDFTDKPQFCSGTVLVVEAGSEAERYAVDNGVKYRFID